MVKHAGQAHSQWQSVNTSRLFVPHLLRPISHMLSDPTRQIADGCFVCTIYCVFTVSPVLTKTTSFSEQGNTGGVGVVLALQCQVYSLANLSGLLFMEICDSLASVLLLKKKKKSRTA